MSVMWNTYGTDTLLLASGGVLTGLAFSYPVIWFVGLFGLVPLFIYVSSKRGSARATFFLGWLFGFAYLGTVLVWFWQMLPLDWLGIESDALSFSFVLLYWGSPVLILALFIGLWAYIARRLNYERYWSVVVAAALFVLFEYLRMWGFALLTFGEGSLLGAHFSPGMVGYLIAEHPLLLQFAGLGGVYLLSFIGVLIVFSLTWLCVHKDRWGTSRTSAAAAALVLLLMGTSYVPTSVLFGESKLDREIPVALVTTYFAPGLAYTDEVARMRNERVATLLGELHSKGDETPSIVVLPENTRFVSSFQSGEARKQFFEEQSYVLIDGYTTRTVLGNLYAEVHYRDLETGETIVGKKEFLVPQGEYTPTLYRLFLTAAGQREELERIARERSYIPGEARAATLHDVTVAARFCSEILSPTLFRELARESEADVLVSMASQAWFHSSRILLSQTLAMAKVRAVEGSRYFIQASNGSPSFVVSERGEVLAQADWGEESVLHYVIRVP